MSRDPEQQRDMVSSLERWRREFPLPEDDYLTEEIEDAKRLLRSLYRAEEAEFVELATFFPRRWNRILPLAYELIRSEDLRSVKLYLFRLMRQQMSGLLRRSLWLTYQKNYLDEDLGDFLLPFLSEQNDHYRGQPNIYEALSYNLHRLATSRILPELEPNPRIIEDWANGFHLNLTLPLGANVIGEHALLWQSRHYQSFAETLFPSLPAMESRLAAQLLRTAFAPSTVTPELQEIAFHSLRTTYDLMNNGSEDNFWTFSDYSLKLSFSRWVIHTECNYQFSESPIKEELIYPLESDIKHIQRLHDDVLLMDLGSHVLADDRRILSFLMLIDKETMKRLISQGKMPDQIIANLTNARFLEESFNQSELTGRWRLGLSGAGYSLTKKALTEGISNN